MDGLTIGRQEQAQDRVEKRSTTLELLASCGSLEVTRQSIEAGRHFNLYAADAWTGFELIYVLEGSLTLEDELQGDVTLGIGDYLYHNGLPEKVYFRVEDDVELLMVSSPPSYHLVRDDMQDMLSMARSVEEKDEATEGHCHRLERLAILTGERLGLSGEQLVDISYGAYLHDIGKVKVPDSILNKGSALTEEEWDEMQRHPEHGAYMLLEKDFLGGAAEIVRAHHERFDGTGYPKGLKGEEIPMGARVIAVVDTYDAMTSTRSYHDALSRSEAVKELKKHTGSQFDPRVVRAFLEAIGGDSAE